MKFVYNGLFFGMFEVKTGEALISLGIYKTFPMKEDDMIDFIIATVCHESLHQTIHNLFFKPNMDRIDYLLYKLIQKGIDTIEECSLGFLLLSQRLYDYGYISAFELEYRIEKAKALLLKLGQAKIGMGNYRNSWGENVEMER